MPPGAPGHEAARAEPVDRRKPDPEHRREAPAARAQYSGRSRPFETVLSAPSRAGPAFSKPCWLFLDFVVRRLLPRFRITKCQNGCRGKAGVGICRRPGRVSNFEARAQVWVAIATEHSVERLRLRCDFSRRLGGRGGACLDGAFEWHQAPGNASPISSARPGVSRLTAPPPAARHEWAGMCSKPNGRPAGSRDCARPVRPANR